MPASLATATIDELQAEAHRLAGVIADATMEKNAIHREMDQRRARASAEMKLKQLSDQDREALRHVLGAG